MSDILIITFIDLHDYLILHHCLSSYKHVPRKGTEI